MRLLLALFVGLMSISLAAAEGARLVAGGGTVGPKSGVAGAMWDDESGAGVRYWFNDTRGDDAAIIVTVCYVADSGQFGECRREHLLA